MDSAPPTTSDTPSSPRRQDASGWRVYVAAGVLYVALGVLFPALLFSWVVGAGFLLLCVVVLPVAAGMWRR